MQPWLTLAGRERDLGGFSVRRILPSVQRRFVGPFVFLDHMGPMDVDARHALDVRPHPHIGLATVTFLFEGRGYHRDSLGSKQMISPGDLNWMTAGRGIVHSERSPQEERDPKRHARLHGVQIWVGLPIANEEDPPSFTHWPEDQLPRFDLAPGVQARVLIGSHAGRTSPVPQLSPTLMMDLVVDRATDLELDFTDEEIGLYVIHGRIESEAGQVGPHEIAIIEKPGRQRLRFSESTRVIVVGGTPFSEPRYLWWNFVSSDKSRIRRAAQEWQEQRMGTVDGEDDFIPLPKDPLP